MLVAADYPFLDILWTMFIFFLWIAWLLILFRIFGDIFRRNDISGWGKAAWVIFVIILPFLGTLIYLVVNARGMEERNVRDVQAAQAQFDSYVKSVAAESGPAGEIEKAKQLLDSGAITKEEFERMKAKALA